MKSFATQANYGAVGSFRNRQEFREFLSLIVKVMAGGVSGVSVPNWESNGGKSNGKPIMEPSRVS